MRKRGPRSDPPRSRAVPRRQPRRSGLATAVPPVRQGRTLPGYRCGKPHPTHLRPFRSAAPLPIARVPRYNALIALSVLTSCQTSTA